MIPVIKIRDELNKFVDVAALKGKTLYDYALEQGFTGTEEELNEKLNDIASENKYIVQGESLGAIADEIRDLNDTTESLTTNEMLEALDEVGNELIEQYGSLSHINRVVNGLPEVEREFFYQEKTVTPSAEGQVVKPDDDYDGLSKVIVEGDEDLKPENIKLGVNIFGVEGEYSVEDSIITRSIDGIYVNRSITSIGSSAFYGCTSLTAVSFPACTIINPGAFADCTLLTSVSFPVCTSIASKAGAIVPAGPFQSCTSLTSVSFPACTLIGGNAFDGCKALTSVSFPACTFIDIMAFEGCTSLTSVSFPACRTISVYAFYNCYSLASVNLPICTNIGSLNFYNCYNLSTIILGASSVCTLANSNAFQTTPYASGYSGSYSGTPYIYVPGSLVDAYKSATNWAYFSKYFSAINEEV